MSAIRLYPFNDDHGIELVKYHVCLSREIAIFFFLQRNQLKKQGLNNQSIKRSGIYYFTTKTFEELKELAKIADQDFDSKENGKVSRKALVNDPPSLLKPYGLKVDGEEMTTDLVCMTDLNNYQSGGVKQTPLFQVRSFETSDKIQRIVELQNNHCGFMQTQALLRFEPVTDLALVECDFAIPFLFNSKRSDQELKDSESWRGFWNNLAVIDLRRLKSYEAESKTKEGRSKDDILKKSKIPHEHDPCDPQYGYLTFQRVYLYQYLHENKYRRDSMYHHNADLNQSIPMFSRCSNWVQDLHKERYSFKNPNTSNNDQKMETSISARFQIGFMVRPNAVNMTEFRNVMITLDSSSKVKQDKSQEFCDLKKFMKIDNYGLKYVIPNRNAKEDDRLDGPVRPNLNFLMPRINDEGNVTGSFFMWNKYRYHLVATLKTGAKEVKNSKGELDYNKCGDYVKAFKDVWYDQNLKWQSKFRDKEGQKGVLHYIHRFNCWQMRFIDGTHLLVPFKAIEHDQFQHDYNIDINNSMFGEQTFSLKTHLWNNGIKTEKSVEQNEFIDNIPYIHEYEILDLNNDQEEKNILLETPLMQLGISKQTISYKSGYQFIICTSRFLKDVIMNDVFDRNMQLDELYRSQSQVLCMSQINFGEVYRFEQNHCLKSYFQPKLLLNGQSLCALDFPKFKNTIKTLKQALSFTEQQCPQSIPIMGSPIDEMQSCYDLQDQGRLNSVTDTMLRMFGINKYQNFMFDLNSKSLIQEGLDFNYTKPVIEIQNCITAKLKDAIYQDLFMQDLPQVFCNESVKIHDFVNRDEKEDQAEEADDIMMVEDCNIESELKDPELPFLGPASALFQTFDVEQNIFDLKTEVESSIKTEAIEIQKEEDGVDKNDKKILETWDCVGSFNSNKVPVEHFILNFLPTIRKIKIDILMNRVNFKEETRPQPVHLEDMFKQKQHASEFTHISDITLAKYLQKQSEFGNKQFFEQTSITKLIDRQFQKTKHLYLSMLAFFFFGYMMPLCVGLFIDDTNIRAGTFIVGGFTQFVFWVLEIAEIRQFGMDEFKTYFSGWNLNDFTMPFIYAYHIFLYYERDNFIVETKGKDLLYNFVTIICILSSILKSFQYVRVIDNFGFLVQMIISVFTDLVPFFVIFAVFVLLFSLVIEIMGADIDSYGDDGAVYIGLPKFAKIMIQIFRNSIGDINIVSYGVWDPRSEGADHQMIVDADGNLTQDVDFESYPDAEQSVALIVLWSFWFINIFLMLIIILNFLIAEVSQTYDRVKGSGKMFLYQKKCEINWNAYVYRKMFGYEKDDKFQIIVFKSPKDVLDLANAADEFYGFTNTIAKDAKKLIALTKQDLLKVQKGTQALIEQNQKQYNFQMAQLGGKIKKINKVQDGFLRFAEEMKANLEKLIKEEKEKNPEKSKDGDEAKVDLVQEDA